MQCWIVLSGSVVVTARHVLSLRVELRACSYGGRTAVNILKSKRWRVAMVRVLIASRNVMQDLKWAIFGRGSEIWRSMKGETFRAKVTNWLSSTGLRPNRQSRCFNSHLENSWDKGKVIPLQARWGPEGARGTALLSHDGNTRRGWVVSSTSRQHFTPGKDPVPILQEAGWAPGPV
jgi:hypothetical protein